MKKQLALFAVVLATLVAPSSSRALTMSWRGAIAAVSGDAPSGVGIGTSVEMTLTFYPNTTLREVGPNCEGEMFYTFLAPSGTLVVHIQGHEATYDVKFLWLMDDATCETCGGTGGDAILFGASDGSGSEGASLVMADCVAPHELLNSTAIPHNRDDMNVSMSTTILGTVWSPTWTAVFPLVVETAIAERNWTQVKTIYR